MRTSKGREDALRDANDLIVEDLGLPMNLMLARSVMVAASAEDALQLMATLLR